MLMIMITLPITIQASQDYAKMAKQLLIQQQEKAGGGTWRRKKT